MTRVLVIEDDDAMRSLIQDILQRENYEVDTARNGLEGVQRARHALPDVILCDIVMPALDGFGVLQALRCDPATATVPFIFLTGLNDRAKQRQGMRYGADDYITKPFTATELRQAVAARLARHATLIARVQQRLDALHHTIASTLPHELRTPLTGILGGSELLLDCLHDTLDRDELLTIAQIICQAAMRLQRLVMNYLIYTELEHAWQDDTRWARYRQTCLPDSRQVISSAARQIAQQEGRDRDLHLDLQESEVQIAEPDLRKIVEEVVHNACKFSPHGTPVRVETFLSGDQLWLVVHDQGCGMSAAQIAELGAYRQFDRCHQEQQGAGLGFILTRRLAELCGGTVEVTSIPGHQTSVTVTLPLTGTGSDHAGMQKK